MASITVTSGIASSNTSLANGSAVTLRVRCKKTFTTSDNEGVTKSTGQNFYKEVSCTVLNGVITHAQFTLDSTEDGNPNDSKYRFELWYQGRFLSRVYRPSLRVPSTPTFTSLAAIAIYNNINEATPTSDEMQEINDYIDATQNGLDIAADASSTVKGKTKLTREPHGEPEAISAEEEFYLAAIQSEYLEAYDDLSDAITTIGSSAQTNLIISDRVNISSTVNIPKNINVVWAGDGFISVLSGSLTIGQMSDPGNKQVFSGNVYLGKGAVKQINLAWWLGNDATAVSGSTVNSALTRAFMSVENNTGAKIYIPQGVWSMTGGLILPDYVTIEGAGNDSTGASATVLKLTTNSSYLFKIEEGARNIIFKDIALSCGTATGSSCIYVRDTGTISTIGTVIFERVSFYEGEMGFDFDPATAGLDIHLLRFQNCTIIGQSVSGIHIDTQNSNVVIDQCSITPDNGADCIHFERVGGATVRDCMLLGNASNLTKTSYSSGSSGTSGDQTLNITGATLSGADVGKPVWIVDLVGGTTDFYTHILSVTDPDTVELTEALPANVSNHTIQIGSDTVNTTRARYGIWIENGHGPINLIGNQDEALQAFLKTDVSTYAPINLDSNLIQGRILITATCTINLTGGTVPANVFRYSGVGTEPVINAQGYDYLRDTATNQPQTDTLILVNPGTLESSYTGSIKSDFGIDGISKINDLSVTKNIIRSTSTALTPGATVALDASLSDVFTDLVAQDQTINAANLTNGQEITLIITTSGTTDRTVTFGTNFKSTGTLSTGTTSGKVFAIKFFVTGSTATEISRTAAM